MPESDDKVFAKREESEDEAESLKEFLFEQADKFFVDHIPIDSIRDLPGVYLYFFGAAAHILAVTMFAYFTYINYTSLMGQAFIALSAADGSDCQSVPIAVTGNFLADNNGNWFGSPDFTEEKAIYQLTLSNFRIDSNYQYEQMMQTFYESLQAAGNESLHLNLADNLVYWMTYVEYYSLNYPNQLNLTGIGYGQLQSLSLTGAPSIVFNLDHVAGRVSSIHGVCPLNSYATYDQANHVLSNSFNNFTLFNSTPLCTDAIYAPAFGYYPPIDDNVFNIKLDVDSFAIAIAVNLGFMSPDQLKLINSKTINFTYAGVGYAIGEYYDVSLPLMKTIYCIRNTTVVPAPSNLLETLCFYSSGLTLSLPVFNPYGASTSEPLSCKCETGYGYSVECQEFNLLSGLVFFKNDISLGSNPITVLKDLGVNVTNTLIELGLFNLLNMMQKYDNYVQFNQKAYNASWYSVSFQENATRAEVERSFFFCTLPSGQSCSLIIFNSFEALEKTVSVYKYQLYNGSCTNSIAVSPEIWDKLVSQPPVDFTQIYLECNQNKRSAFVSAVGIASGNTQIFIPFAVFAILPFLYLILVVIRQVPPKEEYKEQEKAQVMDMLSLLLLRIRDGKTRGIKKGGVLEKLVAELVATAKESGGFPDSDDEEEERDSDDQTPPKKDRPSSTKKRRSNKPYNKSVDGRDSLVSVMLEDSRHESETPARKPRAMPERHGVARRNFAVFTKHLESPQPASSAQAAQPQQQGQQQSPQQEPQMSRVASFIRGFTTTSFMRQSSAYPRGSQSSSQLASEATNTGIPSVPLPPPKPAGIMGYLFGSSAEEKKQEMPRQFFFKGKFDFLDLEQFTPPPDVHILNHLPGSDYSAVMRGRKLAVHEVDLLVNDLLKFFSEAMSTPPSRTVSVFSGMNPMQDVERAQGRMDSLDSALIHPVTRRDAFAFLQGKALSQKLINADFAALLQREDKGIFFKISNVMCMHASVELDCEMKEVASMYSMRIAYNIGGRLVTASKLDNILY